MNRLRASSGFTLIELVVVVAIMGILTAFAVPSFTRYRNREEAKEVAARVAGVLRNTRALAMKQGIPHFILFNPDAGQPEILARVVRDIDGDYQVDVGELVRDFSVRQLGTSPVTPYNNGSPDLVSPFGTALRAPNDTAAGTLAAVVNGASFPIDTVATVTHTTPTRLAAIGFTPRGLCVPVDNPSAVGGASGAFYVTDNDSSVYAAVIGALGEVRVRAYSPAADQWR
jgi:type II secretion system protein H